MKTRLYLLVILIFSIIAQISAQNYSISGTVMDSVSGQPLPGIVVGFSKSLGGGNYEDAGWAVADSTGHFEKTTAIADGYTYRLRYAPFGPVEPVNGIYYFPYENELEVTVNGSDVTDVEFRLTPHPPVYRVSGSIFSELTGELIEGFRFSVYPRMQEYYLNFYGFSEDDGTYVTDYMPEGTYDITVYGGENYYDKEMTVEIEAGGPEMIGDFDFYLEPKLGVQVSGTLLDMETNEPIANRNMRCKLGPIETYYTVTDENGYFSFDNVLPP